MRDVLKIFFIQKDSEMCKYQQDAIFAAKILNMNQILLIVGGALPYLPQWKYCQCQSMDLDERITLKYSHGPISSL